MIYNIKFPYLLYDIRKNIHFIFLFFFCFRYRSVFFKINIFAFVMFYKALLLYFSFSYMSSFRQMSVFPLAIVRLRNRLHKLISLYIDANIYIRKTIPGDWSPSCQFLGHSDKKAWLRQKSRDWQSTQYHLLPVYVTDNRK